MITVDEEMTRRLAGRRSEGAASRSDVGHVMRSTGIKVLRLPAGEVALGWSHGDGTWGLLSRAEGIEGNVDDGDGWLSGRVDAAYGAGFLTSSGRPLWDALREALVMPSPVSAEGTLERRVSDAVEAEECLELALARTPGM